MTPLSPAGNVHEYGVEGALSCRRIEGLGWSFRAILDGSATWDLDILADGRTVMGPGAWRDRVIDRNAEQRLERHALEVEVAHWPHHTRILGTASVDVAGLPVDAAATGPADRWWYDGDSAVQLHLWSWPDGEERWVLRCFARSAERLPSLLGRVSDPGEAESYCTLCGRGILPSFPGYAVQGEPGRCLPAPEA